MTLVPVTPTVALVSKIAAQDPDGAAELVRLGLYEAFCDLTAVHGPRLERIAKRAQVAKARQLRRELVRSYVAKRRNGEDVTGLLAAAAELTAVSKADEWDEDEHPRDPATGRFTAELKGATPGSRELHANRLAAGWVSEGHLDPGTELHLTGATMDGKEHTHSVHATEDGMEFAEGDEPDADFDPSHLSVHPDDVKTAKKPPPEPTGAPAADAPPAARPAPSPPGAGSRALDFGGEFIGYSPSREGATTPGRFERNLRDVAEPTGTGNRQEGDRRAYRQLAVTGRAVNAIGAGNPAAMTVGTIAQVAGELGPQAERVLGPGIRRTAYRYRGTEREPNAQLTREVGDATDHSTFVNAGEGFETQAAPGNPLAYGTAAYYRARGGNRMPQDQLDLRMRGDTAVGYFVNKIPDPERTALSIEAGRVPPSQGTIIDRNGNVVTEAMGAGSDHYLPFDLKNLKSLQGGQYVRTRAAGGPTTEDIYTGLMGGARQIQVASNSGVFTVEFDPSLRGSRRYSDKARSMINRYQALLGRIHDSQRGEGRGALYTSDISPEEKADITRAAFERAGYDQKLGSEYAATALEEARQRAMFEAPSDEELEAAARNKVMSSPDAKGMNNPQLATAITDQFHRELKAVQDKRVERLKLDGQGYYKALQSLQEEFPYFIRSVDFEGLRPFTEDRAQRDRGQAPLRGNPRATDSGFVRRGAVTAHDRRDRSAPERTRTERTERDDSGTGGARPSPAPSGPRSGGGGAAASTIQAVPFKPRPTVGSDPAELTAQLTSSFQTINDIADASALDLDADEKSASYLNGGHPSLWLKAYVGEQGGWGKAAKELATNGTPEQLRRGIQAIDELKKLPSAAESVGGAGKTDAEDKALDATKATLTRILATKSKPKDVTGDRALYDPTEHDNEPAAFDELSFEPDPENLAGWHQEQVKGKYEPYLKAHRELAGKSKEQRARHISSQLQKWQATKRFADAGDGASPRGNELTSNQREARQMMDNPKRSPQYKHLEHLQLAHNFLTQQEGAGAAGGGAAPLAGGGSLPASALLRQPERKQEYGKRRRRVIVHSPESAIAKAWNRARATRDT